MEKENKKFNIDDLGGDRIFVIAEIGKNFIQTEEEKSRDEYLVNAKELIRLARETGADAVKLQTHNVEDEQLNMEVTSPHFSGSDRYSWVKRNSEITDDFFWSEIKKYSDELGIVFFSTSMSRGAAQKIDKYVDLWKVGSGDMLDFVLLDYLAGTGKPIIISSGMSTLDEIDLAVKFLQERTDKIILLHCVSKYPASPEELNLNTIKFFQKRYNMPIGFSDHSVGFDSAVAAASIGAVVVEKHFSLNRELWGSDHKVSMTPEEMQFMVNKIKVGEEAEIDDYGDENKMLLEGESVFRPLFRKSLMAGTDIKAGAVIEKEMLYAMRPQKFSGGLVSEEYENVLGKKVKKDLNKYDPITWDVIE